MKAQLCYTPWRIRVKEGLTDGNPALSAMPICQQVHDGIRKWRRFPCEYGDQNTDERDCVFVLLDRIQHPLALMDPKHKFACTFEKIRGRELPPGLRELYRRLTRLGHTADDDSDDPDGE